MMREVLTLDRLRAMSPDEAAALLAVRRSDGADAHDAPARDAWLALSDTNAQAWARTGRAWLAFDEAEDDELLDALRQDALRARPAPAAQRPQLAAAAVILVLLTGGLFALFGGGDVLERQPPAEVAVTRPAPVTTASYATPRGDHKVFTLADGSRLTLDTDSAVDVAFAPSRRDLRLVKGRAFFEVTHDANRPFAVQAAGREVTALGTRFDVRLDPSQVRVVLVDGRVSVTSPNARSAAPTILRAGQQLVDRDGKAPVVSAANVEETLNWQRGFVTFDDDTLSAAAAELNRYSRDQLVVRDPRVASLRISGVYRSGDVARFGRTLSQIHPVRVVRIGPDQLEIVPAS